MSNVSPIDEGRNIDWGKTSADYSVYRPGPPESFYRKLLALDVGRSGQRILDLGTGTGVLARQFAQQGAVVAGIDISGEQIHAAESLAGAENLKIDFRFDEEHDTLLKDIAGERFTILHRIVCYMFKFKT